MNGWYLKLRELFGIDIRSLAAMRIGLAIILLGDLFFRVQDLTSHYTDRGVLPRSVLLDRVSGPFEFSLHVLGGTWQFELVLFICAAVCAMALLVGYRTRLATALSWILLISVHARNPVILQGGDVVMRVVLFWSMFLPLGSCWSVDRRLAKGAGVPAPQVVSGGTIGLLMQVCMIYWFAALIKTDPTWRIDGTAVWYSLSIEQYATPFGIYLLGYPTLLKFLTFATLYLEAFGPLLAFSPVWTGPLRFGTAVAFMFFHLIGLNLTMELGPFCYICSVAWIAFIPGWFWDRILKNDEAPTYTWRASIFSNVIAIFFFLTTVLWNVRALDNSETAKLNVFDKVILLVRLDQYWNMFSPFPLKDDGWYVIPGKLEDGTEVDLFTTRAVTWEKPPLVSAVYKNDRWRSLMMNMLLGDDSIYLRSYARYLCLSWNSSHPSDKQVKSFSIYFMWRVNDINNPKSPPEKTLVWEQQCRTDTDLEKEKQQQNR